jgi:Flp pilus assembly pilin Flp
MFRQWISSLFPGDLLARKEGQDLAEYGMLAALIAVVVIVALVGLGSTLANLWGNITNAFAALP